MNEKQRMELESKLSNLQAAYHDLYKKQEDIKELIRIIRHPGWTTPAERLFTLGLVEALQGQIKLTQSLHKSLMNASAKVVVKERITGDMLHQ